MRYYDPQTGFFQATDTAIEITDEYHAELMSGQSEGLRIVAGDDGYPVLAPQPEPTPEQIEQNAARIKSMLRTRADDEIEWRQDAVDADIATEEEIAALAAWKKYRVLLMRVDTAAPVWPTAPA